MEYKLILQQQKKQSGYPIFLLTLNFEIKKLTEPDLFINCLLRLFIE